MKLFLFLILSTLSNFTTASLSVEINKDIQILTVRKNGVQISQMKVIIGAPRTPTPTMNTVLTHIVMNPTWTVPKSIQREITAKGTFKRYGFKVDNRGRWVQPSGSGNVLGKVKFKMDNPYRIYLHDTLSKHLFKEPVRRFSHGCVRIERPLELAKILGVDYSPGKEHWIKLDKPIKISIQ